jgi:Glycosyl transferase family 2
MQQDRGAPERDRDSSLYDRVGENAPRDAVLPEKRSWEEKSWRIVHPTVEHVHGPEEVSYGMDELVVLCLVRDGRPYVRSFVEHYFSMGVKHLVFLDNGSTDGTVEALKGYDNVTVLRTKLPFKEHQGSMKRYLVKRFGRGRWSLYVDIDELFDYPYSDVVGLGSLLGYLNHNSYTAVVAQMLDMFPEEPLSGRALDMDEPLKEQHRFYDLSNLKRRSITEHKRCPPTTPTGATKSRHSPGGSAGPSLASAPS